MPTIPQLNILPHEEYVNGYPCFFPGKTGMFVQAEDYDRDNDNLDCGHLLRLEGRVLGGMFCGYPSCPSVMKIDL